MQLCTQIIKVRYNTLAKTLSNQTYNGVYIHMQRLMSGLDVLEARHRVHCSRYHTLDTVTYRYYYS